MLQSLGVRVEVHKNHFVHDAPDAEWIPVCASKGWVILTGDQGIENDGINRAAVIQSQAKVFTLYSYRAKGLEMSAALIAARKKIGRTAESNVGPFYCPIRMLGESHVGLPKFYQGGYSLKSEGVAAEGQQPGARRSRKSEN